MPLSCSSSAALAVLMLTFLAWAWVAAGAAGLAVGAAGAAGVVTGAAGLAGVVGWVAVCARAGPAARASAARPIAKREIVMAWTPVSPARRS